MKRSGLRLMVCPAMEEDEGEGGGEEKYDFNMEYISNIGDIMVQSYSYCKIMLRKIRSDFFLTQIFRFEPELRDLAFSSK